ncbi:MAG: hypothetical protein JST53_02920 [Actinobacteria bacterium]|nr:hypothetical protein [Actinomycetota bacterium]
MTTLIASCVHGIVVARAPLGCILAGMYVSGWCIMVAVTVGRESIDMTPPEPMVDAVRIRAVAFFSATLSVPALMVGIACIFR